MSKRKNPATEAFDKEGPQNLPAGYTWCPECQANFQGEVCPGCVDFLSGAGPRSAPAPAGEAEKEAEAAAQAFEAGQTTEAGEETGPTTLAEVAEQASTEIITITQILPVPITDPEYKEIGLKMGGANQEIIQAENELKSVKSQFKSRIDSAKTRRDEYAAIINAGHQQRQVECLEVKDFFENTITLIRLDTGEVVRTRTMTTAERQRGLDFEE